MTERNRGMSYFQYQFRVVDARSGLIVWEKMLSNKMAGEYMLAPKANAADPNDPNATQGQVPAGWPTGTVSGQPGLPQGQMNTQGVQQPVSQQNPAEMMKQITDQLVPVIQQMQK